MFRGKGGRYCLSLCLDAVCALSSGLSIVGSHGRGTDKVRAVDGCGAWG